MDTTNHAGLAEANRILLKALHQKLQELEVSIELLQQGDILKVNDSMEIISSTDVFTSRNTLSFKIKTRHSEHFSEGIEITLYDFFGDSPVEEQARSAVNQYINGVFTPVNEELEHPFLYSYPYDYCDLHKVVNGKILPFSYYENVIFYERLDGNEADRNHESMRDHLSWCPFTDHLGPLLLEKLEDRFLNWLETTIVWSPENGITAFCSFNNVYWKVGSKELHEYVTNQILPKTHAEPSFICLKTFTLYRRRVYSGH